MLTRLLDVLDNGSGLVAQAKRIYTRAFVFSLPERLECYDNVATLKRANVRFDTALEEMAAVNERLGRKQKAELYHSIVESYKAGNKISAAIGPYVPAAELMALSPADRGPAEEAFSAARRIAIGLQRMLNALVAALAYPVLLIVMAVASMKQLGEKLLPHFEKLAAKTGGVTPMNQHYMDLLAFVRDHTGAISGVLLGLCVLTAVLLQRWTGRGRAWADQYLPPFVLYRLYNAASFILALSCLTSTTMPLREALEETYANAGRYLRSHIERMIALIVAGEDETSAFRTGLLPPSVIVRLTALARSGSIGESIQKSGDSIIDYCISAITKVGNVMRGAIMAAAAGFVLWTITFMHSFNLEGGMIGPG